MKERIQADIERVGWSAIGVMGTEDDPSLPFCYTIGLHQRGHPEFLVIGLPMDTMHAMLSTLYARVVDGERFEAGQRAAYVLSAYDVEFRAVPPDGAPLYQAKYYYDVEELPALQVMWPDKEGRFPGEVGMNPLYETRQDIESVREEGDGEKTEVPATGDGDRATG